MRTSDLDVRTSSSTKPLQQWFQGLHCEKYLSRPGESSFQADSMSFRCSCKSSGRKDGNSDSRGIVRTKLAALQSKPRYLTPTVARRGGTFDEEYVMGCSVCGTKTIENVTRPNPTSTSLSQSRSQPALTDRPRASTQPSSCTPSHSHRRVHSQLSDYVSTPDLSQISPPACRSLTEGVDTDKQEPGPADSLSSASVCTEIVLPKTVSLTPLNYVHQDSVRKSLIHNTLAQQFVREEERQRVVTRRAEYTQWIKGCPKAGDPLIVDGTGEEEEEEEPIPDPPTPLEAGELLQAQMGRLSFGIDLLGDPILPRPGIEEGGAGGVGGVAAETPPIDRRQDPGRGVLPSSIANPQRVSTLNEEKRPLKSPTKRMKSTESQQKRGNTELSSEGLENMRLTEEMKERQRKSKDFSAKRRSNEGEYEGGADNRQDKGLKGRVAQGGVDAKAAVFPPEMTFSPSPLLAFPPPRQSKEPQPSLLSAYPCHPSSPFHSHSPKSPHQSTPYFHCKSVSVPDQSGTPSAFDSCDEYASEDPQCVVPVPDCSRDEKDGFVALIPPSVGGNREGKELWEDLDSGREGTDGEFTAFAATKLPERQTRPVTHLVLQRIHDISISAATGAEGTDGKQGFLTCEGQWTGTDIETEEEKKETIDTGMERTQHQGGRRPSKNSEVHIEKKAPVPLSPRAKVIRDYFKLHLDAVIKLQYLFRKLFRLRSRTRLASSTGFLSIQVRGTMELLKLLMDDKAVRGFRWIGEAGERMGAAREGRKK